MTGPDLTLAVVRLPQSRGDSLRTRLIASLTADCGLCADRR
jgi:hypothetical protein